MPTQLRYKIKSALLAASCTALLACVGTVDTDGLPALDGYDSWYRLDAAGILPGHGESYRVIYANDTARQYQHAGVYPVGSVLVKEIRDIDANGGPGDLRYLGVMRRLAEAPPGGKLEGGWQFTIFGDLGDAERQGSTCWDRCHVQAPIAGAWIDYGQ